MYNYVMVSPDGGGGVATEPAQAGGMTDRPTSPRVVLRYGMGLESTAVLTRWLQEPDSRDFPLADLLVLTAMTGDELPDTGRLVDAYVLPRLRAHRVRFVQAAPAGVQDKQRPSFEAHWAELSEGAGAACA
jgi:hypothetical protein